MIPGTVPNLINLPPGCRFAPRCRMREQYGLKICTEVEPELVEVRPGHDVRCWLYVSSGEHKAPIQLDSGPAREVRHSMSDGKSNSSQDLVQVKNLVKYFPVRGGILQRVVAQVQAVENVSFTVKEGETPGPGGRIGLWENDRRPYHAAPDRTNLGRGGF